MIVQYIKDPKKNKLRGVLMADKSSNDYPVIAWSYTNVKAGDRFDKERGLKIACGRINTKTNAEIPHHILKQCNNFKKRVAKYYKVEVDSINIVGKGEKF